ncbi:MAG: hypothetical protein J6Z27_04810 [Bacteroidales bacterium]|nr:hypothetical protein [Bacteroidales bacterium]
MRTSKILLLLSLLILGGCVGDKEYDLSGGINTEITLFQDEVSLPIGSIGPITIKSVLPAAAAEYVTEGEDGLYYMTGKDELYNEVIYQIDDKIEDKSSPFEYHSGNWSRSLPMLPLMLGGMGLWLTNQQVDFYITNPLYNSIKISGLAKLSGSNGLIAEQQIDNVNVWGSLSKSHLYTLKVTPDVAGAPFSVAIEDFTVSLPDNITKKLSYDFADNLICEYEYKASVAVGPEFSLKIELPTIKAAVPFAQFNLHKASVKVVLENTLPLDVSVDYIRVLTGDNPFDYDRDISVTGDIALSAGSVGNPTTNEFTLNVEALKGTIPDITGLVVCITAKGSQSLGVVSVSSDQGVYVKSSSIKLQGGITIPQNEK